MAGQGQKSSSLSSGEVSRLWEEPTEAISRKRVAVGIASIYGGEDVNGAYRERSQLNVGVALPVFVGPSRVEGAGTLGPEPTGR
jgi:SepF-like predicted cell division protein (DUF552 family)